VEIINYDKSDAIVNTTISLHGELRASVYRTRNERFLGIIILIILITTTCYDGFLCELEKNIIVLSLYSAHCMLYQFVGSTVWCIYLLLGS